MSTSVQDRTKAPRPAPWGTLPPRMRVLYVSSADRTGGWLAEALAADSASDVMLEEAVGGAAGLARLRDDAFDAVLISHEPPEIDALELVAAVRGGGCEDPLVLLGTAAADELDAPASEVGADAYLSVATATIRSLIWTIARAIERHRILRDNHRLVQAERQRLRNEQQEAERMLMEQHTLVAQLESLADKPSGGATAADQAMPPLPDKLVAHYADLLRAYVIMGSGNLTAELRALAELLAAAGVTPQQSLQLHLRALEDLMRGLGARSARHVLTRADLLVLEVMLHLAECYRRRLEDREEPARQQMLPGFAAA